MRGKRKPWQVALKVKCDHCHCKFFKVDEELLANLRDHQPFKKSKESDLKKAAENVKAKKNLEDMECKREEEDLRIRIEKFMR